MSCADGDVARPAAAGRNFRGGMRRAMRHDVVVVGAGPVGSTLALALAAGGIEAIVLDGRAAGETPAR